MSDLALGLGTMVGTAHIVITVGEKIGQTLAYGHGAAAEVVGMAVRAVYFAAMDRQSVHVFSHHGAQPGEGIRGDWDREGSEKSHA
ncbi:hypothetical protein J5289_18200 [Rhizobium sp. B230/85]|uniref:hypothetical protein n=1 Tax=unclassified Rhizobium TaxID=2613769 RepID=UPI001ADCE81C|nr:MULTISPECIES: hypothetical protein [unclassified Rhizobium]MBO9136550.1 hypothetical protein [Rhizobium sp. B209b/85]QXZ99218.1 hypothetical protein J5289_18200 [Rhizobium sp. B230/85]